MTDNPTTTQGPGSATTLAAGPGSATPAAPGGRSKRRRGVTERQRPLWLLAPGGLLMTLIILIPLGLAVWISLIDLDQYTLRRWLDAVFIGLKTFTAAFQSDLLHSI